MYTGKYNSKPTGKYSRKPRISRRSILLTVSVLVLCLAMVGGTVAWLTTQTDPVENVFEVPGPGIEIEEKFDGAVKKDIGVKNTGDIPLYVRLQLVINFQNDAGMVAPVAPKAGTNIAIEWFDTDELDDWIHGTDGFYYYPVPLAPGESTIPLITSIKSLQDPDIPEGYTLNVQVLAQYVQAEGLRNGRPMAEAYWPVTVTSDGLMLPTDGTLE